MAEAGTPDGVVVVDKPTGMTSHDVVARLRGRLARAAGSAKRSRRRPAGPKVGHAGTLDPDATGVLVVCVGRATRLVPYLQASRKTYDARMRLGQTTTTLDAAGELVATVDASHVTEEALCESLKAFVGPIEQIPPMVSAVRVKGERLHEKARRGEVVERDARPVVVHDLVLADFDPGREAEASFLVTCSAGTYVRTLAADIGERLGVGAHLRALRRLASGRFTVDDAHALGDVLDAVDGGSFAELLLSPAQALADYPSRHLEPEEALALGNGRPLEASGHSGPVAALAQDGSLIAVVEDRDGAARPLAVFATQARVHQ